MFIPSDLEISLDPRDVPRDISRASGNILVVEDVQPNTSPLSCSETFCHSGKVFTQYICLLLNQSVFEGEILQYISIYSGPSDPCLSAFCTWLFCYETEECLFRTLVLAAKRENIICSYMSSLNYDTFSRLLIWGPRSTMFVCFPKQDLFPP